MKKTTAGRTEADFEARAFSALRAALPWIDTKGIRHQLTFSFKLGHKSVTVDGASASRRQGRLDILIERGNSHLAILELKKPGKALTDGDVEQGLSYARVLHPRPPIVIVSNGTDTQSFATHDGTKLGNGVASEAELAALMDAALSVAQADLRNAVATLLGPASDAWVAAVRAASEMTMEELSGDWHDPAPTFTTDLHFSRKAAVQVLTALRGSRRVIAVEGAPLSGKTHVLRELALGTSSSDEMAVLFVEASGSAASGIVEEIARLLTVAVGWPIDSDGARRWLETLGKNDGPMLVIAIDALGLEHAPVRQELEALTARSVGSRLKFVIEADTSVVDRLWHGETRRKETAFARRGERVPIDGLDDDEFNHAITVLARHGVTFMSGADRAAEYRQPWLLRAMAASVTTSEEHRQGLVAVLPPLLSLDLFRHARAQFTQDHLCEQAANYARAALDDYARDDRPHEIILRAMHSFMVRKAVLRDHADTADITAMEASGLIGTVLDSANRPLITGRIPELIASELARLLAGELHQQIGDVERDIEAADWLIGIAGRLPFGDVIAAQAIVDLGEWQHGISIAFLNRLLDRRPSVHSMKPGMRAVAWLPSVGKLDLYTRADGVTVLKQPGWPEGIEISPEEGGQTYADLDAWLILSHVAGLPLGALAPDGDAGAKIVGLVHPAILALVGTSPLPLRRVPEQMEASGLHTHDGPDGSSLVCRSEGIVEPVTFSILRFLDDQRNNTNAWLDEACAGGSAPLLNRISLALHQLEKMKPEESADDWASAQRQKVESALGRVLNGVLN